MRLLNATMLLAVATHLVGVGGHTEQSDVVNTDGQDKVQRHLRIQERAHGDDEGERNAFDSLKRVAEAIDFENPSKKIKFGDEKADSSEVPTWQKLVEELYHENSIKTGGVKGDAEVLGSNIPSKQYRFENMEDDSPQELTREEFEKTLNKANPINTGGVKRPLDPEYRPDKLPKPDDVKDYPWLRANQHRLNEYNRLNEYIHSKVKKQNDDFSKDGLDLAGDKLFQEPKLASWVKNVDAFNAAYPVRQKPLLARLLKFYTIETLVEGVVKSPRNIFAEKVQDEMCQLWFKQSRDPDTVFLSLHIEGKLLDSPLFPFYLYYLFYYQSKQVTVQMLEKYSLHKLQLLLGKVRSSDYTRRAEEVVEGKLRMFWTDRKPPAHKMSVYVSGYVSAKKKLVDKGSVYERALQKALNAAKAANDRQVKPGEEMEIDMETDMEIDMETNMEIDMKILSGDRLNP